MNVVVHGRFYLTPSRTPSLYAGEGAKNLSRLKKILADIIIGARPGDKMPDGTIYAGISPDTDKPMYTPPVNAPRRMKWQEASDYAKGLNAHGHNDWRLPTRGELNVLFN